MMVQPVQKIALPVAPQFSADDRLEELRVTALRCRAAPRQDLFKACALLSTDPDVAQEAYARALVKSLRLALDRKVTFYRPGTAQMSFDETWVMRAITCAQQGDTDSFAFLIRSRVPHIYQRQIAYLINGVAHKL
ncbi:hypothetical protein [Yoonia sp. 2307UL14-13]|uniref:hypothetical protein n=1 Tax=Yoonia sp. 2307UL14-13 TaxID=3126506 RepID=UPI0030A07269